MRIVQLANLYSPVSGGLRTAVDMLGAGYAAAGHQRALVVPGRSHTRTESEKGLLITVPGASVAPGYRLVLDPRPVLRVLARLEPDVVEVSDKASLTVAARWARRHGVRAVLFSHERLDAILAPRMPGGLPVAPLTDRWNRRLATMFDAVVATSAFAAAEFARVGTPRLHRVPLGVDLATFRPSERTPVSGAFRLVHLGRLSREKRPDLALKALRELRRRGVPAHLDVIGSGPLQPSLRSYAARASLPVRFHGHVHRRADVVRLLAAADVALSTCPVESFGLAVLEALACGVPVVTADRGAARELLAPQAGIAAPPTPAHFATAAEHLLALPRETRRTAARTRAEHYPWTTPTARMLQILDGRV
ncbi:glycosyltransferase [Actinomadura decatromicini]|uniref:Glycosyltransferase family 1 protein n=1 Tax=Actinomadura decatromicini TaxID=2604572 RepID=A0A5D3FF71_9ACTN|nr:glycosyltransferase [Actinomadura decatromicini]TYK46883.1 glycosyltransferase family 1 protein [Actinomadura decatromicini]